MGALRFKYDAGQWPVRGSLMLSDGIVWLISKRKEQEIGREVDWLRVFGRGAVFSKFPISIVLYGAKRVNPGTRAEQQLQRKPSQRAKAGQGNARGEVAVPKL